MPSPAAYAGSTLHCPKDFSLCFNDVEKFWRSPAIFLAFLDFVDAQQVLG